MSSSLLKRFSIAALLIILSGFLAACAQTGSAPQSNEPTLLRIGMVYGDSSYNEHVRSQYTDLFEFTHENVEIEFVYAIDYSNQRYETYDPNREEPDPLEEMMKLMEGPTPPDAVMVSYDQLASLINENMLLPLEPFMSADNFDISDFVPAVIEGLKSVGNDNLYALAPTFSSNALIYNRGIFDSRGVEYPQDFMTWDEIFDLARRVAHGEDNDRVYGFSFSKYKHDEVFYNLQSFTAPLQLRWLDDDGEKLLVNSDKWIDIWTTINDLVQQKVIPSNPDYSEPTVENPHPFEHDLFLSGKTAMTIAHYGVIDEIINVNQSADRFDGYTPIDWDVVTVPTHVEAPGVGMAVSMDPIIGINAKAENADAAWEFIKFINGEQWAKLKSRSSYNLVSRASYNEKKGGADYNIEAFYALKPIMSTEYDLYMKFPYVWQIQHIGQMKLNEVLEGQKTVEEALSEWQTEGEMMIQQIKENPDNLYMW